MKRVVQLTIVAALASLVPAGTAFAQGAVVPLKKEVRITVAAGKVAAKTSKCPAGWVAASGTIVPARNTAVVASVPKGVSSWRFRVANARKSKVRVNAELRCMRLEVPEALGDVFLRVGTARVRRALVPAGQSTVERVRCPQGQVPTGFGLDHGDVDSPGAGVQVTAVVPTTYGFYVGLENLGDSDAIVNPYGRCVQRTQKADNATHRMQIRVAKFRGKLKGGADRVRGACRKGFWSVDAGFRVEPSASLFTIAARPTGTRGGRWSFSAPSERADAVSANLLCVDLRTQFR